MSRPIQLVILGASGDLTGRKLVPALANLRAAGQLPQGTSVVGVARRELDEESFRASLREGLAGTARQGFESLAPDLHYQAADVADARSLARLAQRLDALPGGSEAGRLVYLALAPELFAPALRALSEAGILARRVGPQPAFRRVVIEKPFGQDLASARALNAELHGLLREDQVYRIDHYLGKETVQNLIGLRFHNAIFEPLWNRRHVELVQITVAESIGVEHGRARSYDSTGALRDVLQNHMLQILALVAMEPPVSLEPEAVRDQKVQVLRSLALPDPLEPERSCVRARYADGVVDGRAVVGYAQEQGVPPDSRTETFVALRAEIDNWRWHGVPFLLRHGKRLARRFTEVQVQFRTPPVQLFNRPTGMDEREFRRALRAGNLCQIRPNVLTLRIQPREAISLSFGVKRPGNDMVMAPAELGFDYGAQFGPNGASGYERLLLDALHGDPTLFLRSDEIEAAWRYADEVRNVWRETPLHAYAAGSWGPPQADGLFYGCEGGWSRG